VSRSGGRTQPVDRPAKRKDVHERALGLLAVRQRSRAELERRLVGAGFGAEDVAAELRRLEQVGLIDDRAFARALAERSVVRRGEGRRVVARRLATAGVARAITDEVLQDLSSEDESERALSLAGSRVTRLGGLSQDKAFSRLSGFLLRRGYSPEVARWAARRALALEGVEG
jgi:SOS response regulatory protein OraA/RecX